MSFGQMRQNQTSVEGASTCCLEKASFKPETIGAGCQEERAKLPVNSFIESYRNYLLVVFVIMNHNSKARSHFHWLIFVLFIYCYFCRIVGFSVINRVIITE